MFGLSLGLGLSRRVASASAPFSPADLANLEVYYNAYDTANITDVAGAVSQIDDESENDYHSSQSTANRQPTTEIETINGGNVLTFDGSDVLSAGDVLDYDYTTEYFHAFIVLKADVVSGSPNIISKINGGSPWDGWQIQIINGKVSFGYGSSSNFFEARTDSAIVTSTEYLIEVAFTPAKVLTIKVNGVVYPTTTSNDTISSGVNTTMPFALGARLDGASYENFFDGALGAVVVCKGSSEMSASDVSKTEDYLMGRWINIDPVAPSEISGLVMSLDDYTESSITQSERLISQRSDLSGNNNHAVMATDAIKPLYGAASTFIEDYMSISGIAQSGDFSIVMPLKSYSSEPVRQYIFTPDGGTTGVFIEVANASDYMGIWDGVDGRYSTYNLEQHVGKTITFVKENNNAKLYVDNLEIVSTAYTGQITSSFEIGRIPVYGIGLINNPALAVYNKALSTDEIAGLNKYYEDRYFGIKGVFLGDSVMATAHDGEQTASFLPHSIDSLAVPGDEINQQLADWNSYGEQGTIDYVYIQVGLNDLDDATTTIVANLQNLIDVVRGDISSSAKIIVGLMTPSKDRDIALYGAGADTRHLEVNEAIKGNGANPITGADAIVEDHYDAMSDGSDNLLTLYDYGDDVHPNNQGRSVNAYYIDKAVQTLF